MNEDSRIDGVRAVAPEWLPPWITKLGLALWVVGTDRLMLYLSPRAEGMLGWKDLPWRAKDCHEVICGQPVASAGHCKQNCRVVRAALDRGIQPRPAIFRHGGMARGGWTLTFSALVESGQELPLLLQMSHEMTRLHAIAEYVERLAMRSGSLKDEHDALIPRVALSLREREILSHLARDEDPQAIARTLFLSPVTVRNHVRHILHKLDVHSVQEAVALHLLKDPPSSAIKQIDPAVLGLTSDPPSSALRARGRSGRQDHEA